MNLLDTASLVVTPNGYKASKLYSIIPTDGSGDMTFARTGDTATRVNSSGLIESVLANKPRLDYYNSTCPKLLLEPQRTNTAKNSGNLSLNDLQDVSIGNNTIASPDGTINADSIIENGTTGIHVLYNYNFTFVSGTTYTFSVWCKKGTRDFVALNLNDGGAYLGYFNLNTGVIGVVATGLTAKMENYGNGWYRCSITKTFTATAGGFAIYAANSNGNTSYAGINGNTAIYGFGLQLEAGAYATSYIPTTTASVTRNADSCTKSSISSLIGQTEGTMFADLNLDTRLSYHYLFVRNAAVTNYIGIKITASQIGLEVVDSNVVQANINLTNSSTGRFKIALAYKANDFVIYINGVQIGTDTSGTVPTCDTLDLYYNITNKVNLNSTALWKTRLQNSELATLTAL